ncbi:MAG: hotdog domain-containing protein [Pseudomonadota bacterium]
MPADTNANGDIFGGWLMAQMDLGASVVAKTRARGRVVTLRVDEMFFLNPVHVGDLVTLYGTLLSEGRTSMRIGIEAWITRAEPEAERYRVTKAEFTFVAIDEAGRSKPLPAPAPAPAPAP